MYRLKPKLSVFSSRPLGRIASFSSLKHDSWEKTFRHGRNASICFGLLLILPLAAFAQEGPITALKKKYTITQTTLNRDQIADPGTVMEVVAHGINAQPWGGLLTFDNPIVDGKVQQRSAGISGLRMLGAGGKNLHILDPGDKVYITKLEVKGDILRMVILTCDKLDVDGADGRRYSAGLSFHFPKDAMAQSSPDELEHTIEQVIAPSTGDSKGSTDQQNTAAAPAPAAPAPTPAPAPPPPPVHTATITIGQTTEQVIAAMGLPLQVIDLGTKKTYMYKDLKIIFVNNKVSDVQ